MKYRIYKFPSYQGSPIETKTLFMAYVIGIIRFLKCIMTHEISIERIEDSKTIKVF